MTCLTDTSPIHHRINRLIPSESAKLPCLLNVLTLDRTPFIPGTDKASAHKPFAQAMSRSTAVPEVTASNNTISRTDASLPNEISEKTAEIGSDKEGGAIPPKKLFLDAFPRWVSTNLRSPSSWKLLARCWLASWAAFLIMVPQPSLRVVGNTYVAILPCPTTFTKNHNSAFFGVMTSLFLPPSLPIQMFLLVCAYFCC